MLSKEEIIEKDNTCKISIPLITNAELNQIDNNLDTLVNQFTKQVVHDKELLITQHIIKRQKEYIDKLETKKQNAIEKLELRIKLIKQNIKLTNDYYYRQELKAKLEITQEILSLVKGENDEASRFN